MDYELKDSGTRSTFSSGAQRDGQEGKGRMDLLPPDAMQAIFHRSDDTLFDWSTNALFSVAKLFEKGAKKYAARNWEKGIPMNRYIDSGLRHAQKDLRGDTDEDHLTAAAWNSICGLATHLRVARGVLATDFLDTPKIHEIGFVANFRINFESNCFPIKDGICSLYHYLEGRAAQSLECAALYFLIALENRERKQGEKHETVQLVGNVDNSCYLSEFRAGSVITPKDGCGCPTCDWVRREMGQPELEKALGKPETTGITEN